MTNTTYCGKTQQRLLPECRPRLIKPPPSPGRVIWGFWDTAASSLQPLFLLSLQTGCSAPAPRVKDESKGSSLGWDHPSPPVPMKRSHIRTRAERVPCRTQAGLETQTWLQHLGYSGKRKKAHLSKFTPERQPGSLRRGDSRRKMLLQNPFALGSPQLTPTLPFERLRGEFFIGNSKSLLLVLSPTSRPCSWLSSGGHLKGISQPCCSMW